MAKVSKDRVTERPSRVPAAKVQSAAMALPTKMTSPVSHLRRVLMLLYGERKIGKTSLAAQFDQALLLATEVGYKGLSVYKVDCATWATCRQAAAALKQDKTFHTICIDTIDLAYKKCEKAVCKRLGLDDPADGEWGSGWRAVRTEFEDWLNELAQTGKGLIILSHAQEAEVTTRTGLKYNRITPTMSKMAREIVEGMVDVWAYYQYDDARRVLTIAGDDHISAGHRFEGRFCTPSGRPLKCIDMGASPQQAYANFVAAFNNEYAPKLKRDLVVIDRTEEEDEEPTTKKAPKIRLTRTNAQQN